jgi:pimeloyl-ACP methyl ester carboxylesterase
MRQKNFQTLTPHGFHRIAYTDWGNVKNSHVLICVHGLTRTGRDFDFLAKSLSRQCRVICPDISGRGSSEWLTHKEDYVYPTYANSMATLLALLQNQGAKRIDWLGTSMGGLIGMSLAAQTNSPIDHFIINDIGPLIPVAGLQRISRYVGKDPRFKTRKEIKAYVRQISAPFGPLSDAQWNHLVVHNTLRHNDGSYGLAYDPGISVAYNERASEDVDLWPEWEQVKCKTLVIRGMQSDLLSAETAQEMVRRHANARLVEIPEVGHAPMFMTENQIKLVHDFLFN